MTSFYFTINQVIKNTVLNKYGYIYMYLNEYFYEIIYYDGTWGIEESKNLESVSYRSRNII